MKIIGIIPARFDSSRFPGKPLIDIYGKSMIRRVYEQALKSDLEEIWIATDDERIYDEARSFNGNVVMTSPSIKNGSERCRIAFEDIGGNADGFINVQGDEPLINPKSINLLKKLLSNKHISIATLIKEENDPVALNDPNRIKVVCDKNGMALLFSRSIIPYPRQNSKELKRYTHIGIYGFKRDVVSQLNELNISPEEEAEQLEQLTWMVNGFKIYTAISDYPSFSIDSPQDLEHIKKRWDELKVEH